MIATSRSNLPSIRGPPDCVTVSSRRYDRDRARDSKYWLQNLSRSSIWLDVKTSTPNSPYPLDRAGATNGVRRGGTSTKQTYQSASRGSASRDSLHQPAKFAPASPLTRQYLSCRPGLVSPALRCDHGSPAPRRTYVTNRPASSTRYSREATGCRRSSPPYGTWHIMPCGSLTEWSIRSTPGLRSAGATRCGDQPGSLQVREMHGSAPTALIARPSMVANPPARDTRIS